MAVEIRELVIRTHIVQPVQTNAPSRSSDELQQLKQQIIRECLKVLRECEVRARIER